MATTNYSINYEDERFKEVENQQADKLTEVSNTYNEMINQSDQYFQTQIDANKQYAEQQQEIQNQQTQLAVDEINIAKDQTEKDYTKEQRGAYTDWQKQSNQYGANAEQMASSGLANTGYSESSQVSMYNQYQSRVATARESYNRAVVNYDMAIKEARLQNSSKLAELAYNALQAQLELSLNAFQYKNSLTQQLIDAKRQVEADYYTRWQNVLSQMNTENALKEQVRQYEQNYALQQQQLAYQKERDKVADSQWQKEYELAKKASSGSYSGGGGGSYSGSSSGSTSSAKTTGTTSTKATVDAYGNSESIQKKSDYYASNGYQPTYINNKKLVKSGLKVWNVFSEGTSQKKATALGKQNIWKAGDKYYVWVGDGKKGGAYKDVTEKVNNSLKYKVNYIWGR